jgi:hypothetical protein
MSTELDQNIGRRHIGIDICTGCSPFFKVIMDADTDAAALAEALQADIARAIEARFPGAEMSLESVGVEVVFNDIIKPLEERRAESNAQLEELRDLYAKCEAERQKRIDAHPDNGRTGFWYVSGIRHETYCTASSAREAIDKAIASGEVGDWESPDATYVGESLPADAKCSC